MSLLSTKSPFIKIEREFVERKTHVIFLPYNIYTTFSYSWQEKSVFLSLTLTDVLNYIHIN